MTLEEKAKGGDREDLSSMQSSRQLTHIRLSESPHPSRNGRKSRSPPRIDSPIGASPHSSPKRSLNSSRPVAI